jgi:hypothetical protein
MKKSLLLVFTIFSASTCFSQISILSSDLTSIGDQITRYGDTIPAYGPGASGANVTWDFSTAESDTVAYTTVVDVTSTGFESTFSSSDYAMEGVQGDSWLYFEHDANSMSSTGAAGNLLGNGDIESPFSDPLLLHEFPRIYQSNFDDTYAFITEASGAGLPLPIPVHMIRLTHNGHVFDTTDAYGTLITPTGTYEALRVKTVDYTHDIIEIQLSPIFPVWTEFSNTMDTTTSYAWHTKEEMLAIAEFTYDSLGNPRQFTYSAVPPVSTVGIEDVDEESPFALYPQPASDQLFIKGLNQAGNHQTQVFSIDGKMVRNEVLSGNSLNVNGLKSGMYILRITLADGMRPEPLKFIVQ